MPVLDLDNIDKVDQIINLSEYTQNFNDLFLPNKLGKQKLVFKGLNFDIRSIRINRILFMSGEEEYLAVLKLTNEDKEVKTALNLEALEGYKWKVKNKPISLF